MLPNIKVVTFTRPNKNGLHLIALRVTHHRRVKYYGLDCYTSRFQFDDNFGRVIKQHKDHAKINARIQMYEERANMAVYDFERQNMPFSFDRFEELVFQIRKHGSTMKLCETVSEYRSELDQAGRNGRANNYRSLFNRLVSFRPNATLSDVSPQFIAAFDAHLLETGVSRSAIYWIMEPLRTLCNVIVERGLMPKTWQPFDNYTLKAIKAAKVNKAISFEEMKLFETYKPKSGLHDLVRDIFLLSFYLRGINLADMATLKRSNMKGDRIKYTRKKTKAEFSLRVTPQARAILDKYKGMNDDYLMPILIDAVHRTDKGEANRVSNFGTVINTTIKEIGAALGIDSEDLTYYTARHTYATSLKYSGVPVAVISEALGHSNTGITLSYLKRFDDSVIDEADDKIF